MYKFDLGIIGGMGSEATVELYNRIISRTKHESDQEHMMICVLNYSKIPDRTKCIINGEESPVPYINEAIKNLEQLKTKYFIIPCNTAHYFESEFEYNDIKFINMIEETLEVLKKNYQNKKICILATHGTINSRVYHNNKNAETLDFIYLNSVEQNAIMKVITDTKSDEDKELITKNLLGVIDCVKRREKDVVFVLACTELSLYLEETRKNATVVDAMDCLVNKTIISCGYEIK